MVTIYKYPLEITDEQALPLPPHAKILSVGRQGNTVMLWAQVETEWPFDPKTHKPRTILIVGTGQPVPATAGRLLGRVETHNGQFVWHVFAER